jgi:hypothetical protein
MAVRSKKGTLMIRMLGISTVVLLLAGCHPDEGERCNPMLFNDECNSGFSCTYPQNCGVAFCCPTTGTSSNPNCQACPGSDGGTSESD